VKVMVLVLYCTRIALHCTVRRADEDYLRCYPVSNKVASSHKVLYATNHRLDARRLLASTGIHCSASREGDLVEVGTSIESFNRK